MSRAHRATPSRCLTAALALAIASMAGTCAVAADDPPTAKSTTTTTDRIVRSGVEAVEFTLVRLPPGRISLRDADGKEEAHEVKTIWIGRAEVTWDEYDVFWRGLDIPFREHDAKMRAAREVDKTRPGPPYDAPDRGWGHEGWPAGSIPIKWAAAYCDWLSKHTGHKYRLPTEAEWEYACRAGGAAAAKPDAAELAKVAWYAANSDKQTHAIAKKAANAWGLYDMLGNVAEWVTRGDRREPAVAGGSFRDAAKDVYPGARATYAKAWERDDVQEPTSGWWYRNGEHVGFRVVRED